MPLRARTLLGPGPSNPYPEATVALGQPLLGHLDPMFLQVGAYAASVWRIGLMGANATPDKAALVLAALKETLGR
jgi:aspartate aminotransferase-like enzyme